MTPNSFESAYIQSTPSKFSFNGTGGQYFRIWVVNVLLILLSCGIYSAWAKVRSTRFFYQNLELEGSRFEYHATPLALLKGYLIIAGFILLYTIAAVFRSPTIGALIALGFFCALPWFVVKALQFKLTNSSYRGVRFSFHGSIGRSYFLLWGPVLAYIALLGIGFSIFMSSVLLFSPINLAALHLFTVICITLAFVCTSAYFFHAQRLYIANNAKFGNASFHCSLSLKSYTFIAFKALLGVVLSIVIVFGILFIIQNAAPLSANPSTEEVLATYKRIGLTASPMAYVLFISITAYTWTQITNAVWSHTSLADKHQFHCNMNPTVYIGIILSNLFLSVITFGLFIPFAKVRSFKYRISCTKISVYDSLEEIVAEPTLTISATGQTAADYGGIGFAI